MGIFLTDRRRISCCFGYQEQCLIGNKLCANDLLDYETRRCSLLIQWMCGHERRTFLGNWQIIKALKRQIVRMGEFSQ